MHTKDILLLGYGSDLGAGKMDGGLGATTLKQHLSQNPALNKLAWGNIVSDTPSSNKLSVNERFQCVAKLCHELADLTYHAINQHQFPIVIGGDHSCAMGTWSGIASALRKQEKTLGLIWIDAHLDSHTDKTTPSNNPHGMPAASLLGAGPDLFTHISDYLPKLLSKNLCFIGIRDFESEEETFIKKQQIRVYKIEEVKERDIDTVLREAVNHLKPQVDYFGITIDLDAFDPSEAPDVNTPVKGGINKKEFLTCFQSIAQDQQLIALEIAEYNPKNTQDDKTRHLIEDLLKTVAMT